MIYNLSLFITLKILKYYNFYSTLESRDFSLNDVYFIYIYATFSGKSLLLSIEYRSRVTKILIFKIFKKLIASKNTGFFA